MQNIQETKQIRANYSNQGCLKNLQLLVPIEKENALEIRKTNQNLKF